MSNNKALRQGGIAGASVLGLLLISSFAYGVTEEIAIGNVEGVVKMEEGSKPALPNAEIVLTPDFDLPDSAKIKLVTKTDKDGKFSFRNLPAGMYTASAYGKVHSNYSTQIVVTEAKTAKSEIITQNTGSALEMRLARRVVLPTEKPKFEISGVTQQDKMNVAAYLVDTSALQKTRSMTGLVESLTTGKSRKNPSELPGLKQVYAKQFDLSRRDIEGVFAESVEIDAMPEGIYLLESKQDKAVKYAYMTVTKAALVTKMVDNNVLAFVSDIVSGKPIEGAEVTSYVGQSVDVVGKTNKDGIVTFTRKPTVAKSRQIMFGAKVGGSRAFTWTYGNTDSDERAHATYWIQTDRPIYRPGDKVQYRGIVRVSGEKSWVTPQGGEITANFYDTDDTLFKTEKLTVSGMGTFSGEMETSTEGKPGGYRIEVSGFGDTDSHMVTVQAFRKPEYSITVTPEKSTYRHKDTIRFKVKAEYYTGEPLVGAKVSASVYRQELWGGNPFDPDYEDYSYESDYMGEYINNVEGTTNQSGEAFLEYNTAQDQSDSNVESDMEFTLSASVADQSGRFFEGKGNAYVTSGDYDINAEFGSYIGIIGQGTSLEIEAKGYSDGIPVAGGSASVKFKRSAWNGKTYASTDVSSTTVTLDKDGRGTTTFTPKEGGDFSAVIEMTDKTGHKIVRETYLWVQGSGFQEDRKVPSLKVVMDKREYEPGDTAMGRIQANDPGGSVLLTVEGKTIVETQVIPITEKNTTFTVKGLSRFAPAVEVHAVYIKNRNFSSTSADLRVALTEKKLDISVVPDKKEAKPGEDVTYVITAKNPNGSPAQADLAVGVVDEGIYAIKEDNNDPLSTFYRRDYSYVTTEYSFPDLYLDGEDKSPANMQVRKTFLDTAFWSPSVKTDASGTAKVTVKMPDNLTKWRTTVTGATADSSFGKSTAYVVCKKDLMARLSLPAFMNQEDRQTVGGLITNGTGSDMKVNVKFTGTGIGISGDATRVVSVPANSAKKVEWTLNAEKPATAKLQLAAWTDNGPNDALELPLNVRTKGVEVVDTRSKMFDGTLEETFALDSAAETGSLKITVEPSIGAALANSLDSLVDYPYGCVEQTLSRFVPALVAKNIIEKLGIVRPDLMAKMPKITSDSLKRLKAMQHEDGGWGWWEHDDSSNLMTAAVLEGLWKAKLAGIQVNPNMIDSAIEWSEKKLAEKDKNLFESRDYLAYAVSLHKPSEIAKTVLMTVKPADPKQLKPTAEDLAKKILGLKMLGDQGNLAANDLAKKLYGDFLKMASITDQSIEFTDAYWGETNGRALQVINRMEPEGVNTLKLITSLLRKRKGAEWSSTRETSLIILGITEYLERSGATAVNGSVSLEVNGKQVATSTGNGGVNVTIPYDQLVKGENRVRITSTNGIKPFYTASFKQTKYQKEFQPIKSGSLAVKREYFKTEAKKMEDGSTMIVASTTSLNSIKAGEVFRVRLTIDTADPINFLMIEDPIPSNCRVVQSDGYAEYSDWNYWWDSSYFLDDKAVFFRRTLDRGQQVVEYSVRAEAGGLSEALPAAASSMYQPEIRATSSGSKLEVTQ